MANMSYCRFQNTLNDLKDCYNHMTDAGLSKDEARARQWLAELCLEILTECTNVEVHPDFEGEIEVKVYDDEETEG